MREVESRESKLRIAELERLERLHNEDYQKLRKRNEEMGKEIDHAKVLLKEKGYENNARRDISTLTSATNQYLRQHGGKLWAFDQFSRMDELTRQEFERVITILAAIAANMEQTIQDKRRLGAQKHRKPCLHPLAPKAIYTLQNSLLDLL